MKVIKGGITNAKGFKANGLYCGIKRSGKPDLSLIYSEKPVPTAGVFTKNSVKAAPVILCQEKLRNNQAQAIIINSGNANCFTGKLGYLHAKRTAKVVADLMKIKENDVLVASTGIIGKPLPFEKIAKAAPELITGLSTKNGHLAAEGILTTDLSTKEIAVELTIAGQKVTIGGCAKGSGMIAPNMATMLAFITTDVAISPKLLKIALKNSIEASFNSITVDGCMSTNDMCIVMASGLAGNKAITKTGKDFKAFCAALQFVCTDLAKKIVRDGEGATKFIEVNVIGAKTYTQAKTIAMAIANSNLVKTAAYGSNPNWGRVAAAVGSLGLNVNEKTLKINFSSFAKKDINITVGLDLGTEKTTVYTTDLSCEYVKINGKYT